MDKATSQIISLMPTEIKENLTRCSFSKLQEIRFRAMRPVMLYYSDRISFLTDSGEGKAENGIVATNEIISKTVANFCRNSVYAHKENIKEGFITLPGGHRVGIGGRAVNSYGCISNITDFSSLNIRIACEYKGCASECISYMVDNGRIDNTVFISPPGGGKTTLLRDTARILSADFKVSIVDERFEIAAEERGVPGFDIGIQTDVVSGFSKSEGITHALRSLSPDVIICDEIGTNEDCIAIENILKGGCKIVTSMHGYSIEEAIKKKTELMALFDVAILLCRDNGIPEVKKCIKLWE